MFSAWVFTLTASSIVDLIQSRCVVSTLPAYFSFDVIASFQRQERPRSIATRVSVFLPCFIASLRYSNRPFGGSITHITTPLYESFQSLVSPDLLYLCSLKFISVVVVDQQGGPEPLLFDLATIWKGGQFSVAFGDKFLGPNDLSSVRYHIIRRILDAIGVKDRQQEHSNVLQILIHADLHFQSTLMQGFFLLRQWWSAQSIISGARFRSSAIFLLILKILLQNNGCC